MTYYIYSTLATDMKYTEYHEAVQGQKVAVVKHSVVINGKVGVANKQLITPRGAVTKVTDEDFAMLKKNELFNLHEKNGFITHEKKQADIEKVVVNMKPRDVSAPITPAFYDTVSSDVAKPKGKGKRNA